VRVSTLPTGHGERVVLRLLDKERGRLEPESLGMSRETLAALDRLVKQPHGIEHADHRALYAARRI